jgi:site-specific DNA-cytosine methylase
MASLQGYPADYVFVGSPTDVSVMVGNSVQIDTARAILEGIVEDWRETSSTAVGNGRERAHA